MFTISTLETYSGFLFVETTGKDPLIGPRVPLYTKQNAHSLVMYIDDPDRKNGGREDEYGNVDRDKE